MALYNEILVGRYNRSLQKLFGIKGSPPAPQLSSDIQTSHSFFSGQENRYPESWYLYGVPKAFAASAANRNQFRIRNGVTSGVIAVVSMIHLSNNGAANEHGAYGSIWSRS